eukprot:Rmarinus@m.21637
MSNIKIDGCRLEDEDASEIPSFLADHLRCPICAYIGISWKLLPCMHLYCDHCANALVPRNCPQCRKSFTKESIRPAIDKNMLAANVPVLCNSHGRSHGCTWKGTLESRSYHLSECGYQPVECSNDGCTSYPLRKDLETHLNACDFRVVTCSLVGCSVTFQQKQKKEIEDHEANCTKVPVPCDLCKESVCREDMELHIIRECGESVVTCAEEYELDIA